MQGDERILTQEEFDKSLGIKEAQNLVFTRTSDGQVAIRVKEAEDVQALQKKVPKITNIEATNNTTEYSHTFLENTKGFEIKCRTVSRMRISFTSGETDTKYITIDIGGIYREEGTLLPDGFTIYFKCENNNRVVEILEWA